MATRISQDQLNQFINPKAAMAPYERAQEDKKQRIAGEQAAQQAQMDADAKLSQLIKGQELKDVEYQSQLDTANSLRQKYGPGVSIDAGQVRLGAVDPIEQLIKRKQLEQDAITPGQKAADQAFGKEYADFVAGGGSELANKNLGLLEEVRGQLKAQGDKAPNIFQKAAQFLPDPVRAAVTPDIKAQEDQVRTAVQASLKQTLGAQFAQQEGEQLMKRSYDPRLSAAQNLAKIEPEINALKAQLGRKMQSAQQFERTGSIRGIGAAGGAPIQQQAAPQQATPQGNDPEPPVGSAEHRAWFSRQRAAGKI